MTVKNAHVFYEGMKVAIVRDLDTMKPIAETEIRKVYPNRRTLQLRAWPKADIRPGDLLLVTE
jgi:hypothetical protein